MAALTNFALDKSQAALIKSKTSALDDALDKELNGGSDTSVGTKQGVSATGKTPSSIVPPSDNFIPEGSGDTGAVTDIPRDIAAKHDRYEGMSPLFFESEDGCYCVIQLVPDAGAEGSVESFEDFILTQVQSPMQERQHIFRNFENPIFYFSGADTEIFSFAGHVMTGRDSKGAVPLDKFVQFYRDKLRGTIAVENRYQAVIAYNGWLVAGYVSNFVPSENSTDTMLANFSFQLSVTKVKMLNAPQPAGTFSGTVANTIPDNAG